MAILNEAVRAIIDGRNYATVATVNPDGSPQTSVVWCERDGDDLLFSTTRGRRKTRNMERDPRVSVSIFDREDPYKYAELRGTVRITEENGRALIDKLSNAYHGKDFRAEPEGTVRVVVRLTPEKVTGYAA
ncbi:PPOX class F420-dependent oxidoreductase [Sciscionella sediminilitoris]|uniref:PPOX class F420-dependent oxidoreductase n=1 Tax=Sciscionella sediminilitoris TaxID=1445613 RepID=UPI0004DF0E0A|nr:PPOX class F420-dependent oxidoreductase [Sciscionella sp. SE31]